jgi:hypothetical protein
MRQIGGSAESIKTTDSRSAWKKSFFEETKYDVIFAIAFFSISALAHGLFFVGESRGRISPHH